MKILKLKCFAKYKSRVTDGLLGQFTVTWYYVSPKYLVSYVDETTFRVNERNCEIYILERIETLTGQISNRYFRHHDLIKPNGLSSKVVPV